MKIIIVWFRNDLRISDNPALYRACQDADLVVPLFIFNDQLLSGINSSSNRNKFLIESILDLRSSLKSIGADLLIRHGYSDSELTKLASEVNADSVYYAADYTPYSIKRDKKVKAALEKSAVEFRGFPGRLTVAKIDQLATKSGSHHKVFTPFWKQWSYIERREVTPAITSIKLPSDLAIGSIPKLDQLINKDLLSPDLVPGGETEGRKRLKLFIDEGISKYHQGNNYMAGDDTSHLSSYLHFGCLSPREIETMLPDTLGARAWHRQLAWREFYNYILFNFPDYKHEFQDKYRNLKWVHDKKLLKAWQDGQTGYPAVDAGMRQLKQEGWMHNRARLIVGSFLTKDLWIDWRAGEAHFMRWLVDGDIANNNGNWQWIASVGVDPAPVYRRLYNPSTQQENYDPNGDYVRRYVPELSKVPNKYLSQPWTMPGNVQEEADCIIGESYPAPVVDHKIARLSALEHYRNAM
jgi:deoxyribodipyrimidine photo-lyase